ncbi:DUF6998 domain-containing protein [Ensifer adhaerens]|uniref:DUF6998 domain-containing protein n=1 Tax=Ensifer adhaerens TaxID=106592 RepID=UPI003CD04AD5
MCEQDVCDAACTDVQQHILQIFHLQKRLKEVNGRYRWAGLGNLLGDFGEFIAIRHYGLKKAGSGSRDYDATWRDQTVQIKVARHSKRGKHPAKAAG